MQTSGIAMRLWPVVILMFALACSRSEPDASGEALTRASWWADAAPGAQLTYDLAYHASLGPALAAGAGASGGNRPIQAPKGQTIGLTGTLVMTVVSATEGGELVIVGELIEPRFELTESGKPAAQGTLPIKDTERNFATPFLLAVSTTGRVNGISQGVESPLFVQTVVRALVSQWQYSAPAASGSEWTTEEEDASGSYQAQYRVAQASVEKAKLRYVKLAGAGHPGAGEVKGTVLNSKSVFTLDEQGRLASVTAKESLRMESTDALPSIRSDSNLQLRLLRRGSDQAAAERGRALQAQFAPARPLSAEASEEAVTAELDRVKMRNTNVDELIRAIQELDGDADAERKTRDRAFISLLAWVRRDPSALEKVSVAFETSDPSIWATVLGSAGSERAQDALEKKVRDETAPARGRFDALRALSLTERPTAPTLKLFTELLDHPQFGRQSAYGLGSAAFRFRESAPDQAEAIASLLLARLKRAATPTEQITALRALGNAGHPDSEQALRRFSTNANPKVQVAAVRAMRRVPGKTADAFLTELSENEASAKHVREAARHTLRERPTTP